MASLARAAARSTSTAFAAAFRSTASAAGLPKPLPPRAPSSAGAARILRRSAAAMAGGMETLMPLHSAVASARLKSFIAVDSSCWSWLSQGRALPL